MDLLRYRHVPTILLLAAFAGCTQPQNSQELKEKTAQATAEVKRDAKAVAAGIREGRPVSPDFGVAVDRHRRLEAIEKAADSGRRQGPSA